MLNILVKVVLMMRKEYVTPKLVKVDAELAIAANRPV
ncbi:hypothetical protein CDIMF43_270004 [Carnobacterium divergens]|nr:hypothetical protein CDIMF43_270004 [Carnobacterium divergens]